MRKIVWIAVILILILLGVFYFRFQTYFIENKISEELPSMTPAAAQQPTLKEPKILKQGNFVDADFFHKGMGKAFILEYPDGRKILRFENFEVVNGPDLYVYFSKKSNPTGDIKSLGDFIDLGRLKGNIGDQNYELPQNILISDYQSAVIWCKRFGVLFPYAILNE